jgi:hypothetical protein
MGSAAMLLARPQAGRIETINDRSGFLVNAYRAIQYAPDETARWADWPVTECDLHARHAWLLQHRDTLPARLEGDPLYYDAQIAGWWIWGACCWIGDGWCSGDGPWQAVEGHLRKTDTPDGIRHKLPHLGDAGRGIHRQLPHLGNAGQGIKAYFQVLATRLRRVRITCGDWTRVVGDAVTIHHGLTGVFLDPPYPSEEHDFGYHNAADIWEACWAWAQHAGTNPLLRIVLCGYHCEERPMPPGWRRVPWTTRGGYGSQANGRGRSNASREVLYCSPHCLVPDTELPLFATRSAAC